MLRATRIRKELQMLESDNPEYIHLRVDEENTLLWNYLIEGPPGTPYQGGWFWGILKLPENYPFAPPSILMLTPNGRFETNTRICMSMSDFHPESWQPAWWLSSLMKGLLSFMLDEELTTGAIIPPMPEAERRKLAGKSLEWTRAQAAFQKAFPDIDNLVEAAHTQRPDVTSQPATAPAEVPPVEVQAAERPDVTSQPATAPAEVPPAEVQAAERPDVTSQPATAPAEVPPAEAQTAERTAESSAMAASAATEDVLSPARAAAAAVAEQKSQGDAQGGVQRKLPRRKEEVVVVDDDPRPFEVGETVRVKVQDIASMPAEERQYAGREGVVKKSARPGSVRVLLARTGDAGVNFYFRPDQLERIRKVKSTSTEGSA